MGKTNIWWIRRDIRLHDNQALTAAVENCDHFVPLFIIEPELMENAAPKRRRFLLNALADLDQQLKNLGSRLILRQGPAHQALQPLVDELGNATIFAHEDFSPFARQRDSTVSQKMELKLFPGVTLRHPSEILKENGEPYIVFTPFKNKWQALHLPTPADCLPAPENLPPLPQKIASQAIHAVEPLEGFPATSQEARSRLMDFTSDGIQHYKSRRDRLDLDGTSQLSPYLRFGLLSAKETISHAQIAYLQAKVDAQRAEIQTWISELIWREFYTAILYHFPSVTKKPFRENYEQIHWREAPEDLQAWQEGITGYPIVDACMRQLKQTGWMHNRGRMITASFLTKDLLINWQEGEAWFMANLVDGDPAANNGGWQWSAGTGTDAAPYFRIFNPVLQGQKFDPDGAYIAQWVPSLCRLPAKFRHEPWTMGENEAQQYDFRPGHDYPERIVDHSIARQRTLDAYRRARENYDDIQR